MNVAGVGVTSYIVQFEVFEALRNRTIQLNVEGEVQSLQIAGVKTPPDDIVPGKGTKGQFHL